MLDLGPCDERLDSMICMIAIKNPGNFSLLRKKNTGICYLVIKDKRERQMLPTAPIPEYGLFSLVCLSKYWAEYTVVTFLVLLKVKGN